MLKLSILFSVAMMPLLSGCYDNGTKEDCVGLSCPPGLFWPDGGEVRIQYIKLPDGTDWRIITAFFIEAQTPERISPPTLGHCAPDPNFGEATSRTYTDVGESITVDMGDQTITAPKVTGDAAVDFIGRRHDLAYISETYDDAAPQFFNAKHSAQTDEQMDFSDLLQGIYVPPTLEVLSPQGPGVIPVKRHQDLLVQWQEIEPPNPDVTTAGVILFLRDDGPPITCVGPNNGQFIVSADDVDNLLPEQGGIMQVGTASDQAILTDAGRRIDLWGTNCIAMLWTKVD
ncbi:MAG TPA: hypothetical protein VK698_16145 [Kofleriaceae bacterium]|nr:hypothetical protein [Kofleriaceae bacterium]